MGQTALLRRGIRRVRSRVSLIPFSEGCCSSSLSNHLIARDSGGGSICRSNPRPVPNPSFPGRIYHHSPRPGCFVLAMFPRFILSPHGPRGSKSKNQVIGEITLAAELSDESQWQPLLIPRVCAVAAPLFPRLWLRVSVLVRVYSEQRMLCGDTSRSALSSFLDPSSLRLERENCCHIAEQLDNNGSRGGLVSVGDSWLMVDENALAVVLSLPLCGGSCSRGGVEVVESAVRVFDNIIVGAESQFSGHSVRVNFDADTSFHCELLPVEELRRLVNGKLQFRCTSTSLSQPIQSEYLGARVIATQLGTSENNTGRRRRSVAAEGLGGGKRPPSGFTSTRPQASTGR
ncbi:hypothetical protein RRG08_061544 [Elysia crispata]|uniref:Uncharacterized protein n=1 Tax=Elysia crispata TaxID=231223 RepID=A0AAE1ARR7_9GAST|nr:hypothetical protein RRG08_061544 [Elysia crispata]